jgi:nucleosome binding factor SPN SPT16 subunit
VSFLSYDKLLFSSLQDWLTSIEIKYYESKVNLNWKNILKSIKEVGKT